MKYFISLIFLLLASSIYSQETRMSGDTLILSNGFRILPGDKLKTGVGTMPDGSFKFIRTNSTSIFNYTGTNQAAVNSANAFHRSNSNYEFKVVKIDKRGTKKNGYKYFPIITRGVRFEIDIENAIQSGEIIIPDEYITKNDKGAPSSSPLSLADELKKLKELYEAGAITEEEYTAAKKKLLGQ